MNYLNSKARLLVLTINGIMITYTLIFGHEQAQILAIFLAIPTVFSFMDCLNRRK